MPARVPSKKPRLEPKPDYDAGLEYWASVPASNNGVLGGFGDGTLPRIDALTSRMFLLSLLPRLSTVTSSIKPLPTSPPAPLPLPRTRALDVGAGIGRVTSSVLIHLLDTVEILEPAPHFLAKAVEASPAWKGLSEEDVREKTEEEIKEAEGKKKKGGDKMVGKAVRFWEGGLAGFDPNQPGATAKETARRGVWKGVTGEEGKSLDYDVIWCQWCLGHLSTPDLIAFFKLAKLALNPKEADSLIVVKENLCPDEPKDGAQGSVVFDDDDSSLTRSDLAWKAAFKQAGLKLIREEVQSGFPEELFPVKMYALR